MAEGYELVLLDFRPNPAMSSEWAGPHVCIQAVHKTLKTRGSTWRALAYRVRVCVCVLGRALQKEMGGKQLVTSIMFFFSINVGQIQYTWISHGQNHEKALSIAPESKLVRE